MAAGRRSTVRARLHARWELAPLEALRTLVALEWPLRLAGPLFGEYNPFLPENRRDPYPMYARLQRADPVHFSRALRVWVLSRHEHVSLALKDPRFCADRVDAIPKAFDPSATSPHLRDFFRHNLLMLDPPDHTRLRRLVNKAFTPKRVRSLRERIQQLVDELFDRAERSARFDWVEDFAVPLPVTVIAELLGVPTSDRGRFKEWSDALTLLLDPISAGRSVRETQQAAEEIVPYLRRIADERRRAPRDDLISGLVAAEEQGQSLRETELLGIVILLLVAGHETTTGLLGNAVIALLRHPEERERLTEDPSLIESAVEELLRFDSPVQATDRLVAEDIELGGRTLRRGDFCVLLLGAANRDPQRFADPDRLDPSRADNAHLAFGHGAHYCLGAALARLEAQVALGTLLRRFPRFSADADNDTWRRSIILRGPRSVPMTLR